MNMNRNLFFCLVVTVLVGCEGDVARPAVPQCSMNSDCNDTERCLAGYCLPSQQSCVQASDCSGYNSFSCLAVACSVGICNYENICQCEVDSNCPGHNKYTCLAISCVAKSCVVRNSCPCNTTKDCDDNNICTEDVCTRNGSQQICAHFDKPLCGNIDGGNALVDLATPTDLALSVSVDLGTLADAGIFPDLAQAPMCNNPADCDDHNPCTADVCEINMNVRTCRHVPQTCSSDGGVSDAAITIDLAMTADLAIRNDLAQSLDLVLVNDLVLPINDLAQLFDLSLPVSVNDLISPASDLVLLINDLASTPRDLAPVGCLSNSDCGEDKECITGSCHSRQCMMHSQCNDNDPCTLDFCDNNNKCTWPRLCGFPDLASQVNDLASLSDLARVPDLAIVQDLVVPSDLATLVDMETVSVFCKWTYNLETDAGPTLFSSISMSMKVNGGPLEELCVNNFASSSIMCSKFGIKPSDQMDISVEYVLNNEPSWSCFGHGALGEQRGVLTCAFSHTQNIVDTWQKVTNGGLGASEGCNLRAVVPAP